ncbi:hypothetical protein [Simiduia aestuariiviva]|uniref:Secreted protein n=1 Tax=Simiduia aestuariiviva TaxID=1510459 RepID=A0A839UNI1_9GAMM|nr:hypothetical protein [Simiduia aestuariiviva]MBB3167128.1 hypothetical protein [Simiduia aestuariiviva]
MFKTIALRKPRALLFAVLALCLVFSQALETQHDHQQLRADCYLCQHAPTLACDDDKTELQRPEPGLWLETSPYHRIHRHTQKRGKRDPPSTREASA